MKILGIITARGGSKGVPGKNIKLLGDLPLIAYSINSANNSALISKTILSTDDAQIIEVAQKYKIEIPFVRPENLATDTSSSIDVVRHAVEFLENQGQFFDAVCLLQPTSPFREKNSIDKAIEKFINSDADCLLSVLAVPHEFNPHWVFEPNTDNYLKIATGEDEIIKRRQDLPKAYFRDGSIYLTKTSVIKNGSFYGEKISYLETNPDFYVNIDTEKDFEMAQQKLNQLKHLL